MSAKQQRQVIVTTDSKRRGVFYGTLNSGEVGGIVTLTDARMIVRWVSATHGVLGLAATGPADGSRVSPPAPQITLDGVTAIIDCAPIAVIRFAEEIWS